MSATISITYPAKCKDCKQLRYFYRGKQKRHKCLFFDRLARANDRVCSKYVDTPEFWNVCGVPESL